MSSYENCSPDADLVPCATLESIFEMEQIVEALTAEKIGWRVVEHGNIIFKSFSGNIGHSTLWVEKNKISAAKNQLVEFRMKQAKGTECPSCGLMLGPTVENCPACDAEEQVQ